MRIEIGGGFDGEWVLDGDTVVFTDSARRITVCLKDAAFDGQKAHFAVTDSDTESAFLETHADLHRRFIPSDRNARSRQVTTQNSSSMQTEASRRYLDIVWYEGEEKDFDLSKLKNAFAVVYVSMDGAMPAELVSCVENDTVFASAALDDHTLTVSAPSNCVSRFDFTSSHQVK